MNLPPPNMNFGKYRGCPVDEVPHSYLRWALNNADCISGFLRDAIEMELGESTKPGTEISTDVIRQARRQLSSKYHPDRGGSRKEMSVVNDCFDVLQSIVAN